MSRSHSDNQPNRREAIAGGALLAAALAAPSSGATLAGSASPAASGDLVPAVVPALAEFIANSYRASWPDDILEHGRLHILDTVAAIVVCRDLPAATLALNYVSAQGMTERGATILGTNMRAPVAEAAFAGAMAGHAAEINDYSPSAFVQPGPSAVATAFALGEVRKASGRDILRAVIAGYEIGCRIPKTIGNKNLRRTGLANHGIGSLFCAGATAGSLIRLTEAQIPHLLSYCSQQASGSWQWLLDNDHVEKAFVFAGMGSRNGVHVALMVEAGFTGVRDNLDRPGGWLDSAFLKETSSDFSRSYLTDALGVRFEIPLVGYKRYAAGGPTQASIQALLTLITKTERSRVAHVLVEMPSGDVGAFANAEIPSLNIPYMCALILAHGKLDFDALQSRTTMLGDPQIRALMRRVSIIQDPSQDRIPRVESARVTITLNDGTRQQELVEAVAGFPTNPLSREDVEAKAHELISLKLGSARATRLVALLSHLDQLDSIEPVLTQLQA
jgi:2-methylcitrate dehydratase PrpD